MVDFTLDSITAENVENYIQKISGEYDIYKFSGIVNSLFKK